MTILYVHVLEHRNKQRLACMKLCEDRTDLNALVTGARGHSTAVEVVADVVDQVLVVCIDRLGLKHARRLATLHSARDFGVR